MSGIIYVDGADVVATSGHMLVTFKSGGEAFRFHLPGHLALTFRGNVMRDAWQVCCAPDGELVQFRPKSRRKAPRHGKGQPE